MELLTELHEHIRNLLSVVRVGASFVLPCVLASGVDGGRVSKSTEITQDACLRCCVFFLPFLVMRIFLWIILLVHGCVCLSPFGVLLRVCTSRRSGSSWSLVVIVLSRGCSFCVVDALLVMSIASLMLSSPNVAWFVVVLELVVMRACSWCV